MGRTFSISIGTFFLIIGNLAAHGGLPAAQGRAVRSYAITDIGTLGGASSEASGLNNLGDVVGAATTTEGSSHAFLYQNGRMFDLGVLPGGSASHATAINDRGDIVGYGGINAYGPPFQEFIQGFVLQNGTLRAIGALYCPCSFNVRYGTSTALAVSNTGWIAGDSQTSRQTFRHAFLWRENAMRDLNSEADTPRNSYAYGINDILEVVGAANDRAFIARPGSTVDLGVLPGHVSSSARAVNNIGQVVGSSADGAGVARAFLWDLGAMRDLGTLPADAASQAYAINVNGDVVGRSGDAGFSRSRAVLWHDGVAIDLNRLIAAPRWTLSNAAGINDFGQIAGVGTRDGQVRAFLLTPQ